MHAVALLPDAIHELRELVDGHVDRTRACLLQQLCTATVHVEATIGARKALRRNPPDEVLAVVAVRRLVILSKA